MSSASSTRPASVYYERALQKLLSTGQKPAHPTGAYCLFSSKRRKEILLANPKISQKEITKQVAAEWKTTEDRHRYQEMASKDYQDYKRLVKLWSTMQSMKEKETTTPVLPAGEPEAEGQPESRYLKIPKVDPAALQAPEKPAFKETASYYEGIKNGTASSEYSGLKDDPNPTDLLRSGTSERLLGKRPRNPCSSSDENDSSRSIWTSSDEVAVAANPKVYNLQQQNQPPTSKCYNNNIRQVDPEKTRNPFESQQMSQEGQQSVNSAESMAEVKEETGPENQNEHGPAE